MDQRDSGWDPEVKNYFLKIARSFSLGLMWMMMGVMLGLYLKLGYPDRKPVLYPILFYAGMFISFLLLLRYLYVTWKKK